MTFTLLRGDHVEIAEALCAAQPDPKPVFCSGRYWQYSAGVWRPDDGGKQDFAATLRRGVKNMAGCKVGERASLHVQVQTVDGVERLVRQDLQDERFFDNARGGLCVANGFLSLNEGLIAPSPDHRARFALPCAYDPDAQCPNFMAFLESIQLRPNEIACIQEFFGVALFALGTRLQKVLILLGNGSNGRSALADILERFYDKPACLDPQQWGTRFLGIQLMGKQLNMVREMSGKAMLDDTNIVFKKIAVGEPVTAESKGKDAIIFRPVASHVFLPNNLPYGNDLSHGFWRRMLTIEFRHTIEEGKQDRGLADRIGKTETAGILTWLLTGAKRALARGSYTEGESHVETLSRWQKGSDVVQTFLDDIFVLDATQDRYRLPSAALYKYFVEWCKANGHTNPPSNTKFGTRLVALLK